ncbi:hypothetical protein BTH42_22460 [Burkholderia sp. SRS-W-2-2016]|uniref:phage major capsid family protein n=1 Tax=Burkholderia sp. SRS-W-2-2016 TaxID=1926878 RepID=UPI00094AC2E7|nr:phage major capsid protein [Burkholderia sp. SRS-W-2-2016]OLL29496.1 hypothetical protein BTH42_22460 [Burkholderia sp. SRS-W-2-2016]
MNFDFARLVAALAAAGNGGMPAARTFAAGRWGEASTVARALQRAVETGSLGGVDYAALAQGFIQLLQADSIIERLDAISPMRRAPFFAPLARETKPARVEWTAEGMRKIVADMSLAPLKVQPRKIAGGVVMTVESLRQTAGELERAVSASLAAAYAMAEGATLLSAHPGDEARPAGLLYGITPTPASGAGADAFAADVHAALANFRGDLSRSVWIANAADAVSMNLLDTTFTANVTASGGVLGGLPLVASPAAPQGMLVLVDVSALVLAADPPLADVTSEATIDVVDDDGVVTTALLWQSNLTCVLIERRINWLVARDGAVAAVSGLFADAA